MAGDFYLYKCSCGKKVEIFSKKAPVTCKCGKRMELKGVAK